MQIRVANRLDCENLGEIIVSATHSAFAGRVPEQCLRELPVATSIANWQRAFDAHRFDGEAQQLLVAEFTQDNAVGFVLVGGPTSAVLQDQSVAARFPMEIVSLHVAPKWQRHGVGRRLIGAAVEWLTASGTQSLAVRVIEQNPNRAFYVHLGAEPIISQPYDWAGFATNEIIYGWRDIHVLHNAR